MPRQTLTETFVSKEPIYHGSLIDVERWQVQLPNGRTASREMVRHIGAAAVVAVDDLGQVYLVSQYRCPAARVTFEIPAGKLNFPGEDPLACAKRELSEETGLTAENWRLMTIMLTTPGFCDERIHLYLATGLHAGPCHPDEDEFLFVHRLPLNQAVSHVMEGTYQDGKTALALLMASQLLND